MSEQDKSLTWRKDDIYWPFVLFMLTIKLLCLSPAHSSVYFIINAPTSVYCAAQWKSCSTAVTLKTRGPRWPCITQLITRQVSSQLAFWFKRRSSTRFPKWRPFWISNQNNFSYFRSTIHLVTSNEVSSQLAFWFRIKKKNRFSTWQLGRPSWISNQNNFSYFFIYKSS